MEALLSGIDAKAILLDNSKLSVDYLTFCFDHDKLKLAIPVAEPMDISPEEEHARRAAKWNIPEEFLSIDVEPVILSCCSNDAERERAMSELREFRDRDLEPILRLMIYLVATWREAGVVWGVGRGSSVSSFVLYLIGINRINPMLYGLDISEFLR